MLNMRWGHQAFLCLLMVFVARFSEAAIFGQDNRMQIAPHSHGADLARSTAIAVLTPHETWNAKISFDLDPEPMSDVLCKDERFLDDPSLSYSCSGFLVAPDLIVTAGHLHDQYR